MYPNLAVVPRRKVEELEALLKDAEHRDEAMELIRLLIETIVPPPPERRGLDALLHGDLAHSLMLCSGQQKAPGADALRGFTVSMLAGT